MSGSVSIFFFAGDFAEAFRRYSAGEAQTYATHDEVSKLLGELQELDYRVTVYSFFGNPAGEQHIDRNIRQVSLGASAWNDSRRLLEAVRSDASDALIPHFANARLIRACLDSRRRTLAIMANSSNQKGLKSAWRRRQLAKVLRDQRLSFASNHCLPATLQLQAHGVPPDKLIPWDVPHQFSPADFDPRSFPQDGVKTIAYAGSISRDKGVGDLLDAIAHQRAQGREIRGVLAGGGDIAAMEDRARKLGIASSVDFLGMIDNSEVIRLFRNSDLVCIPSRPSFGEGFPLTMFEAIACRTPIVCSDHPMFTPVMLDRKRAMCFRARDPRSLSAAISAVSDSAAVYASLSHNADDTWRHLAVSADWRTMIKTWLSDGSGSEWLHSRTLAALNRATLAPGGLGAPD